MTDDIVTDYQGLILKTDLYASRTVTREDDGQVDPSAVEHAAQTGDVDPLTPRELVCVIYTLAHRGMRDCDIARHLGVTRRVVYRIRTDHGVGAVPRPRGRQTPSGKHTPPLVDPDVTFEGTRLRASRYHRDSKGSPYAVLLDDGHVDVVAVQRFVDGDPCRITPREQICVVAALARRGHSDATIAERVGVTERHAIRLRAEHAISTRNPVDIDEPIDLWPAA